MKATQKKGLSKGKTNEDIIKTEARIFKQKKQSKSISAQLSI